MPPPVVALRCPQQQELPTCLGLVHESLEEQQEIKRLCSNDASCS